MRRPAAVGSGTERIAWHRRLAVRVFVVTALIAVVAIAAATTATVQTTSVAVEQQQQDSLHADAVAYGALTGYAATHRSWSKAGPLLRRLSAASGRRLALVGADGRSVLTPGRGARLGTARATAVIDALDLDPSLPVGTPSAAPAQTAVPVAAPCVGQSCRTATVGSSVLIDQRIPGLHGKRVVVAVTLATGRCMRSAGVPGVPAVTTGLRVVVAERDARTAERCLDLATEEVLRPAVAPRATLIDRSAPTAGVFWDLSAANRARIAVLALAVLLVVLLAAAVLAAGLTRPLRRMTAAARRAAAGDLTARMPVRRQDEVGQVAQAFNAMADERERLERSRERLMRDVSHDLRSPLSNVRGWIEAAQDGVVETDGRLLTTLHDEALHLQTLIDDLEMLAAGDLGARRLEIEPVEVGPLLQEVAEAFRPTAIRADVTIGVEGRPGAPVAADPARLRQIVANLVSNAVRHTPGGTVLLRATAHGFEVEDTGEGIPATETAAVFERFHRVDDSRTRATGGSGLGLAIVRQLVEEHGGRVGLTSRLGVGTVVRVELPPVGAPRQAEVSAARR